MNKPLPSQQQLQALFEYSPVSGLFTYKLKPNFRIKIGSIAGTIKKTGKCKGYCYIKVNGQLYQASRLAWMYIYGVDPGDLTVDHIDRNPSNNAIDNLRLATLSEQSFNRTSSNKLGIRGVHYLESKDVYIAHINFRQAGICTSKQFSTAEEAAKWYEDMRRQYGKQFAILKNDNTTADDYDTRKTGTSTEMGAS